MSLCDALLAEFEQEAVTTRKFLERIPADKLTWKPHEKSMTAGQLALHIATCPKGVLEFGTADDNEAPNFGAPNPQPASVEEILAAHDSSVKAIREKLPTFDDAKMARTWRVRLAGKPVLKMPRSSFFRSILMNHWIHHRGQLGVYLRMLGAKVPSSYGPSGDEQPAFLS